MTKFCCRCGGMGHYAYQCRWKPEPIALTTPTPSRDVYYDKLVDDKKEPRVP